MGFGVFWKTKNNETLEEPKKLISKTGRNGKTVGDEYISKKYLGSSQPLFKRFHPEIINDRWPK